MTPCRSPDPPTHALRGRRAGAGRRDGRPTLCRHARVGRREPNDCSVPEAPVDRADRTSGRELARHRREPSSRLPASIAIGEIDQTIFDCPSCSRPLALGDRRCPGCRTRLLHGVQRWARRPSSSPRARRRPPCRRRRRARVRPEPSRVGGSRDPLVRSAAPCQDRRAPARARLERRWPTAPVRPQPRRSRRRRRGPNRSGRHAADHAGLPSSRSSTMNGRLADAARRASRAALRAWSFDASDGRPDPALGVGRLGLRPAAGRPRDGVVRDDALGTRLETLYDAVHGRRRRTASSPRSRTRAAYRAAATR